MREYTVEKKFQEMTEAPIELLICKLAIPTIITMLISAIYNMADTFFVGKIGTSATGAVGVAFSLMAIIQAIGFTFGMGSGNYISRLLGSKDREKASEVASVGFLTALGVGTILMIIGLIFINPLIHILGATPTIAPYAKSYVRWILIGMPFMAGAFVLNNLFRLQGNAFYGMLGMGAGGILNIILDPIFIFKLNFGVAGAAMATVISQIIGFFILLWNTKLGGNLRIRIKKFRPNWQIYKEIFNGGLPSFYRQALASIATICLNICSGPYGDAAIAAMTIVGRIFQFALSALLGFGQGFQPVCGFNYGAKKYGRVRKAFWFCVRTSFLFLVFMSLVGFVFAPQIVAIFQKGDSEVIEIGVRALRIQCFTFPLTSWIIMNNMLMQTIGKSLKASLLALARQGLFFLPTILILSNIMGLLGIQMSQSISDILSFLLAIPLGISVLKELRKLEEDRFSQTQEIKF